VLADTQTQMHCAGKMHGVLIVTAAYTVSTVLERAKCAERVLTGRPVVTSYARIACVKVSATERTEAGGCESPASTVVTMWATFCKTEELGVLPAANIRVLCSSRLPVICGLWLPSGRLRHTFSTEPYGKMASVLSVRSPGMAIVVFSYVKLSL
jgi:hypothetical protein